MELRSMLESIWMEEFIWISCCHPNTHLQTWRSLQPTWCVLGGTNLNPDPLSPQSGLLPSRLTPREAKGVDPIKLCEEFISSRS
jgi:hypothetical protein